MAESNTEKKAEMTGVLTGIDLSKKVREGKNQRLKKKWAIVGASTVSLLAVLVAVVVVISVNMRNNTPSDESGKTTAEIAVDEYMEVIEDDIASATTEEEKIMAFNRYIEEIDDKEELVELLNRRIDYILSTDFDKEFGQYVIDDAATIDAVLQTVDSARQVWNYASYYGSQCVMDEFEKIIKDRGGEANSDEETLG